MGQKLFKTLNTIDVSYPKSITRITNNKYSWLKKNISSYGGTKVSNVENIDTKISDPKEYFHHNVGALRAIVDEGRFQSVYS